MPCVHRSAAMLGLFLFVAPLAAQNPTELTGRRQAPAAVAAPGPVQTARTSEEPSSLAPTPQHAMVGIQSAPVHAAPALLPRRADTSRNRALMIVGGATLLVGAIVSGSNSDAGTIIMIGGGAIGLYGLYKYLQ